jgi:hypothetical protein
MLLVMDDLRRGSARCRRSRATLQRAPQLGDPLAPAPHPAAVAARVRGTAFFAAGEGGGAFASRARRRHVRALARRRAVGRPRRAARPACAHGRPEVVQGVAGTRRWPRCPWTGRRAAGRRAPPAADDAPTDARATRPPG